eukprot:scaffold1216_cov136-Amphora_coffeaeformis.AAC.1
MVAERPIVERTLVSRRIAMLEGRAMPPPSLPPPPPRDNAMRKTRTAPLTGESVEDFFQPTGDPLLLRKNSSSLSSRSTKSTRTVSSLRSEPVRLMVGTDPRLKSVAPLLVCEREREWDGDFDEDLEDIRKSMERVNSGSPRSVVIPDMPMEEERNFSVEQVFLALEHSPDVSFGSADTPHRNFVHEQAANSNVSLSATDVKFFVKALKRYAGEDFSDLIQSIKKKQEPNFQRLSSQQQMPEKQQRTHVEPVNESCLEEEEGLDLRIEVAASACPAMVVAHDKIVSDDYDYDGEDSNDETHSRDGLVQNKPLKLKNKMCSNSALASSEVSYDTRSWGSEDTPLEKPYILQTMSCMSSLLDAAEEPRCPVADDHPGDRTVDMSRKISFSAADRVRLYDLTDDEIVHKRINDEEDEVFQEARRRRQKRKIPGVFCASGPQANDASELLAKLYAGGMETAKGIHKKCEEKGWLRDVDGLFKYFGKGSSKSKSLDGRLCGGGGVYSDPEPKEDQVAMEAWVPVIQATESREGLQVSLSRGLDRPKASEPTRRGASRKVEHMDWIDIASNNPFRNQEKSGSLVKVSSLSFDSHAPSDEGSAVDEIMPPTMEKSKRRSHIHLLEIKEAENEEEVETTRFEC